MALLFIDSFDNYTSMGQKWETPGTTVTFFNPGRTGVAGMRVSDFGIGHKVYPNAATAVVGFGLRFANASPADQVILLIEDNLVTHLTVSRTPLGRLKLTCPGGSVTGVRSLLLNTWYFVEVKLTVANVGGVAEVRVNEEVWATFNGDTQNGANAFSNDIGITGGASGFGHGNEYDDFYILDNVGPAPNNDYLGDTQIHCLLPDGNGFYQEFATLVGAASHFQAVDEVPPDGDTSYVADNVINRRDTYTFQDLPPAVGTINGLCVNVMCREDTAGGAMIARMYRNGGVDNQGADVHMNTSYAYWLRELLELDPIAAAAWTIAAVNSAEFGQRVR